MSSRTSPKIRLVRCPKCRHILPELPDVPVYECGGCGTRLQAKIKKENANSTTAGSPETNTRETSKLDYVSEDNKSSSSIQAILHSAGECSRNQNNGRYQIESSDCRGDKVTVVNLQNEDEKNAGHQSGSEDFESQQLQDVNLSNDDRKSGSDKKERGVCYDEQVVRDVYLSREDRSSSSHRSESLTGNVEQLGISNEDCSLNELSNLVSGELAQSPLGGTISEVEINDESSLLALKVEAEADHETSHSFTRSSQGELVHTNGSVPFATAHWLEGANISSDILDSSPHEVLEQQPQESSHHRSDRVKSTDTFETTEFFTPSSELSGTFIDLSKSPTTRSSRAYYDDGVSSYEGTDDQLPDRHKYSCKYAYRLPNNAVSDMRTKRERFPGNSDYGMQHHFRSSASVLPGKMQYSRKSSNLDRDELLEPTRLNHLVRNWRRAEIDQYPSQHLLHRSGSPSSQLDNGFNDNSSFPSQDKLAYTEREKMKLLRMVYELQDQLNSSSLSHKENRGVSWKDDRIPMYYDPEVLQQESLHNLYIPRYSGALRDGRNRSQQRKYSRIPFSDEATTSRHQVDHSFCSCPQDWQRSAQVPSSLLHHNKGFCDIHSRFNLYNSYGSCPSSPQRYIDSEFPTYSRGTKSDDQRHRDHEVKKYLREKHHLAKRHLRPIAGGVPLITCPCCLKQLQLPADFVLFKRRFHRLKCGACSEVLKFSLVNRTHLIPYTPTAEPPPPSEVDEYNDATHRRNFTSTSHVSDCPCPDSVSSSDDFTEETSFHAARGNAVQRNVSSSSLDHGKERKRSVLNVSESRGKKDVEAYESAGPSTSNYKLKNVSSEIEELPASPRGGGGSPLHRLMGYSSPSALVFGWGPSDPGTSSYHSGHNLT
ncbi:hypothetical protein RCOM_0690150 [Ricinus communis]|uniref:Uncharacterized protein n=1 Tax=Ricinus communis TaxID=3988 RepID=B9S4G7_RICCO|nr:hypothetical protein RCOM_0690150 [Ricinus communis]|eukprot:XP_002520886.1 uncharacterized protein LOC8276624 [Ricinus communis]